MKGALCRMGKKDKIGRLFYKQIDKYRNEDTLWAQFLKLIYSLGQIAWLHTVISACLGILIPILFDNGKIYWGIAMSVLMVLDIIYAHICNKYKEDLYLRRKFASQLLSEQSALINSVAIEIDNNKSWRTTIFKTVSELVCDAIYRNFKDIYNCETRISVEYVFDKIGKNSTKVEPHVKMSGRKSIHRKTVRKASLLSKRKQYYSCKIFTNNNTGINILTEEQISDKNVWYKNPKNHVEVKRYIGIAVSIGDDETVKFILQIDFLDDIIIGDNNSDHDIKEFVDQYLTTYINIISLSYLLNLNNKRVIQEV